ncbi:hypothetical protein PR202_ga07652 [Eleusine coracana subsp. coracana]|uniref:Uncharacterized protein n=1 Tax=Eleusine coracana subsp. coracana TaxID=191504 RepID=A0AAV5BYB4_ELECO|nr:hypothetical protein PR202_ga07652 [Eleusine coracana subsp. coracana]
MDGQKTCQRMDNCRREVLFSGNAFRLRKNRKLGVSRRSPARPHFSLTRTTSFLSLLRRLPPSPAAAPPAAIARHRTGCPIGAHLPRHLPPRRLLHSQL